MDNLEYRTSGAEGTFEQLEDSVDRLEESINRLRADLNAKFNALVIVTVTGGLSIFGSIVLLALRT